MYQHLQADCRALSAFARHFKGGGFFHVAITGIPFAKGLYLDAVAELISRACPNKQKQSEASPTHSIQRIEQRNSE
ncbi:hypothetical protein QFZ42_002816 [Variovorax paradoxus]|uniref:hypothetical protein n=1 Tax=Variovorax paradoxus TaxID=34073 RepID=UPI00278D7B87|nr:hypothetical protein [Variovorax paradoxus]MDQ0570982.1 hypothetical protein [Variovorax paradoxus]